LVLSLGGEFALWIIYSPIWYPEHIWETFRWTLSCGWGMGATIGAITCLFIVDRLSPTLAIVVSFVTATLVFGVCSLSCFLMDRQTNYWGAATHSTEFLLGSFIGTFIGAVLYAGLVFGRYTNKPEKANTKLISNSQ
jgi:quinol-cytochrome oxidoreductase complex cytochrome b subunit